MEWRSSFQTKVFCFLATEIVPDSKLSNILTSNNLTAMQTPQSDQALYNGQHVIVLDVELQDQGSEALISYEDGHDEYVPLSSIEFI